MLFTHYRILQYMYFVYIVFSCFKDSPVTVNPVVLSLVSDENQTSVEVGALASCQTVIEVLREERVVETFVRDPGHRLSHPFNCSHIQTYM